jgi:hypothetical protein
MLMTDAGATTKILSASHMKCAPAKLVVSLGIPALVRHLDLRLARFPQKNAPKTAKHTTMAATPAVATRMAPWALAQKWRASGRAYRRARKSSRMAVLEKRRMTSTLCRQSTV